MSESWRLGDTEAGAAQEFGTRFWSNFQTRNFFLKPGPTKRCDLCRSKNLDTKFQTLLARFTTRSEFSIHQVLLSLLKSLLHVGLPLGPNVYSLWSTFTESHPSPSVAISCFHCFRILRGFLTRILHLCPACGRRARRCWHPSRGSGRWRRLDCGWRKDYAWQPR